MSLTISTDIMCDRCSNWDRDITRTGVRTMAKAARKAAKHRGWHIGPKGFDLCPECVKITEWPEDMRPSKDQDHAE